ncbi:DUF4013 domain-containing protein [Methanobrevibacter sp.]|uniref:DUF4013 domain-containing protein n=1 Tax=Methanobrevibacter sp. TaxID=66852 RepID=UPI00389098C9
MNFLIIPLVFFFGYNYRVIKLSTQTMINVDEVPPDFSDLKGMFIDGLKYLVVYIVYEIIPIIILVASNIFKNSALYLVGIILALIFSLFAFLAVPHMAANNDSLKSAFEISKIKEIMSFIGYGRYLLAYIGILLITIAVFIVITLIIGLIFGAFGIAVGSLFTTGVGSTAGIGFVGMLITNIIMLFLVAPYMSLFQNRCQGLIYNLRG